LLIKRIFIFLLLVALLSPAVSAAPVQEYVIVVHKDRQISSLKSNELKRMFLGKVKKWPDGETVVPVFNPREDAHSVFTRQFLHKSPAQLKTYLRKRLFSGLGMMPYSAANNAEVMSYLSENTNAISYMAKELVVDPLRPVRVAR